MTVRAGIRRHSALGFTNPSQFGPRKKGGAVASTSGRSQRRRDPPSHQRAPARRWHSAQPSLRLVPLAAHTSGHRQTLPLAPQPAGNLWQNSTVELRVFTRPRSNPAAAARSVFPVRHAQGGSSTGSTEQSHDPHLATAFSKGSGFALSIEQPTLCPQLCRRSFRRTKAVRQAPVGPQAALVSNQPKLHLYRFHHYRPDRRGEWHLGSWPPRRCRPKLLC